MELPFHRSGEHRRIVASLANVTVSQAAEKYRAHKLAAGKWQPLTAAVFDHEIQQAVQILGDHRISEITSDEVELLWFTLAGRSLSKQWIERVRVDFQSLFRWCLRHGAISADPTLIWERTEIGDDDHARIYHDFSHEEIEHLAAAAKPPMAKFIWTACYTGLRRANVALMIWSWIDGSWVCEIPSRQFKQRRPHRIPIHLELQKILAPRGRPEDRVIPGLCYVTRINKVLKEIAAVAGIQREFVYPHNFRRTFFAWLKKAGVSREKAMDLAGSRSESVLIRHYWPRSDDSDLWSIVQQIR